MAEYIDRYEAIEALIFVMAKQSDIDSLLNVPVADVAPVVHAHWGRGSEDGRRKCSHCGMYEHERNYCGFCGAYMDERSEDE